MRGYPALICRRPIRDCQRRHQGDTERRFGIWSRAICTRGGHRGSAPARASRSRTEQGEMVAAMTYSEQQRKLSDLIGFQCALVALRGVAVDASEEMLWQTLLAALFEQYRSEEHTSELQSLRHLVCRLL